MKIRNLSRFEVRTARFRSGSHSQRPVRSSHFAEAAQRAGVVVARLRAALGADRGEEPLGVGDVDLGQVLRLREGEELPDLPDRARHVARCRLVRLQCCLVLVDELLDRDGAVAREAINVAEPRLLDPAQGLGQSLARDAHVLGPRRSAPRDAIRIGEHDVPERAVRPPIRIAIPGALRGLPHCDVLNPRNASTSSRTSSVRPRMCLRSGNPDCGSAISLHTVRFPTRSREAASGTVIRRCSGPRKISDSPLDVRARGWMSSAPGSAEDSAGGGRLRGSAAIALFLLADGQGIEDRRLEGASRAIVDGAAEWVTAALAIGLHGSSSAASAAVPGRPANELRVAQALRPSWRRHWSMISRPIADPRRGPIPAGMRRSGAHSIGVTLTVEG
ncbi:MAG: hypothetical protein IPM29_17290 [Planctomycetes bacterium]|nr:hypothetical protein [Planctomycetota bacterium]